MIEIDLNPDNEHQPERTAHTADVMSDCVRILNYAVAKGGLVHASDGYHLLGELRESAWREAELLDRIAKWAHEQSTMGAWKVDGSGKGEELGPRVVRLIATIRAAQDEARKLTVHLTDAQNVIAHIANTETGE